MRRLDDDEDAVVVAVAEPVERHGCARSSADKEYGPCSPWRWRNSVRARALLVVLLLVGIGAGAAAYRGAFYVTGSQFYEACRQRQAKEKIDGGFKEVEADWPAPGLDDTRLS